MQKNIAKVGTVIKVKNMPRTRIVPSAVPHVISDRKFEIPIIVANNGNTKPRNRQSMVIKPIDILILPDTLRHDKTI